MILANGLMASKCKISEKSEILSTDKKVQELCQQIPKGFWLGCPTCGAGLGVGTTAGSERIQTVLKGSIMSMKGRGWRIKMPRKRTI